MGKADAVVKQAEAVAAQGEGAIVSAFSQLLEGVREIAAEGKAGKQVKFHEAKFQTPWNPTGEARKAFLKFPHLYQNGARCEPELMTDEEIQLANQLKPGKFLGGKWEVQRKRDKSLNILYPNGTIAQRFDMAREAGSLANMLKKILVEQEARVERKKRGVFDEEDEG